jgi:hypothetical protein
MFTLGYVERTSLPFVSVCAECGLSHRAVVHKTKAVAGRKEVTDVQWGFGGVGRWKGLGKKQCVCGAEEKPGWMGFKLWGR